MDSGIQSDIIRGHIDMIIMNSLLSNDRYGYEIVKEISERTTGQFNMRQPTLYSCLKRLEKQGWIKSYWGTTISNGGRRRYYSLSEVGRDIYNKKFSEWEYSRALIDKIISSNDLEISEEDEKENSNLNFNEIKQDDISVKLDENQQRNNAMLEQINNKIAQGSEGSRKVGFDINCSGHSLLENKQSNQIKEEQTKMENQTIKESENKYAISPKFLNLDKTETQAEREYKTKLEKILSTATSSTTTIPVEQTSGEIEKNNSCECAEPIKETAQTIAESEIKRIKEINISTVNEKVIVETNEFNLMPHRQAGKVDFSNLQAKLQSEGFKIRTYSHEPVSHAKHFILINKVLLHAFMIMCALAFIELAIIYFGLNTFMKLPIASIISFASCFGAAALSMTIVYAFNPKRKRKNTFKMSFPLCLSILCLVGAFVISISCAFIQGVDMTLIKNQSLYIILPSIMMLNLSLGVIFYSLLIKSKRYLA